MNQPATKQKTQATAQAAEALQAIRRARMTLLLSQPFWGNLAIRLHLQCVPDLTDPAGNPSMGATDGRRLLYRPDMVLKSTSEDLRFFVAHEVMHCALNHPSRRGMRDPMGWNIAADFAVNGHLRRADFKPTEHDLDNPAFDSMSAEAIYETLPKAPKGAGSGQGKGKGANQPANGSARTGHVMDATNPDDDTPAGRAEAEKQAQEWKSALQQAAKVAKQRGTLPAGIEELIEDLIYPAVSPRDFLRQFVTEAKDDYSWSRPNRRHIADGLYLPSLRSERLPDFVMVMDTSGSMDKTALEMCAGVASEVLEEFPGTKLTVIYADAAVAGVEEFTAENLPVKLHAKGRGGTSFIPAFEYVEQHGLNPACLVYVTDGYGDVPEVPSYPVLWATTTEVKGPWGETIHIAGE